MTGPGSSMAGMEPSPPRRLNVDELLRPPAERRLGRLPRLVAQATALAWRAGPRQLAAATALQLVAGAGVAAQLLVGRRLLAGILDRDGASFSEVAPELGLLVLLGAVVSVAGLVRGEQQRLMAELVGRHSADRVLEVACAVELVAFEHPEFADRLKRAQVNAAIRPTQVANGLLNVIGGLSALAGIAVALLLLEPLFLVLVVLAYVPASLASARGSRLLHRFSVAQTEVDRRRAYLYNLLSQREEAAEVRSFGLARFLRGRHDRLYDERIAALKVTIARRVRVALAGQLLTSAFTALALGVLLWMVTTGRIAVPAAGAAASAMAVLGSRLGGLVTGTTSLYEAALFLEDFTGFVEAVPVAGQSASTPAADGFSRLTVEQVSFTYPSRTEPSLRDVSMEIRAGQVVALVGVNGSGKTTLAKVLAGLYQPSSGTVRWDGVDVAGCDPDGHRRAVAVILQDFVKYHLTARDNIALGDTARYDDAPAVEDAARATAAHGFLSDLEHGYDTRLGPEFLGGTDLSVGQWQRVALARAFFRDAAFIILDEPTAAVDPRAERELFDAIRRLFSDRSVLLVSHRFANVRSADRIYVLDGGRVAEVGTHDELIAEGGLYAELFTIQASSYVDTA